VLGVGGVGVDERYWQEFSFLEAVARLGQAGLPVSTGHVARNRTLEMLATAMAAEGGLNPTGGR
jgi:hypothetical protein